MEKLMAGRAVEEQAAWTTSKAVVEPEAAPAAPAK